MNDYHYPFEQLRALRVIRDRGFITKRELCRTMHKSTDSVKSLLEKLQKHSLIAGKGHAMGRYYELTERGAEFAQQVTVNPETATDRVVEFFISNPDEELTTSDIEAKFDLDILNEAPRLAGAISAGYLCRIGQLWAAGDKALVSEARR